MIAQIQNKYTHQMLHDRFVKTLYSAKKTPNDRALSHKVLQDAIGRFVGEVVDHDVKHRTAMELPQQELWQAIPEEWTDEQIKQHFANEQAKMADWLKKNKKKPKTAEEDAADKKELISRVTSSLSTQFTEQEIDKCESEIDLLKTEWLMENHLNMDANSFERLNRIVSILDIDIND